MSDYRPLCARGARGKYEVCANVHSSTNAIDPSRFLVQALKSYFQKKKAI